MTFRITCPADVDTLVRQAMHFAPADSFVVVPVCNTGAPFARIDLATNEDMRDAFRGALPQWSRVIVAIYGDAPETIDVSAVLPGVEVVIVVDLPNPTTDAFKREDLTVLAMTAETVDKALTAAMTAYEGGDGALAWTYLDRAEALNDGVMPAPGQILALALQLGVKPPTLP